MLGCSDTLQPGLQGGAISGCEKCRQWERASPPRSYKRPLVVESALFHPDMH